MIKVEAGSLTEAKGIAFAVVGVGPFEEPGENGGRVKTSIFAIHANSLFTREYEQRVEAYNKAFACDCIPEYEALNDFRKEACSLVCSPDADLRQVAPNAFVITWRRTVAR